MGTSRAAAATAASCGGRAGGSARVRLARFATRITPRKCQREGQDTEPSEPPRDGPPITAPTDTRPASATRALSPEARFRIEVGAGMGLVWRQRGSLKIPSTVGGARRKAF